MLIFEYEAIVEFKTDTQEIDKTVEDADLMVNAQQRG